MNEQKPKDKDEKLPRGGWIFQVEAGLPHSRAPEGRWAADEERSVLGVVNANGQWDSAMVSKR